MKMGREEKILICWNGWIESSWISNSESELNFYCTYLLYLCLYIFAVEWWRFSFVPLRTPLPPPCPCSSPTNIITLYVCRMVRAYIWFFHKKLSAPRGSWNPALEKIRHTNSICLFYFIQNDVACLYVMVYVVYSLCVRGCVCKSTPSSVLYVFSAWKPNQRLGRDCLSLCDWDWVLVFSSLFTPPPPRPHKSHVSIQ